MRYERREQGQSLEVPVRRIVGRLATELGVVLEVLDCGDTHEPTTGAAAEERYCQACRGRALAREQAIAALAQDSGLRTLDPVG